MKKKNQLKKVEFKKLLEWFSTDEVEAGEIYQKIYEGLQRYFRYRGCSDSNHLADETINRVAKRLPELDLSKNVKKISIFYGFALNIYREYLNKIENREVVLNPDSVSQKISEPKNEKEMDCVEKCLSKLSDEEKKMVLKYYSLEKGEKIILRKQMAEEMNITTNALHVKIYRLKGTLKTCIENCLKKSL